MKLSEKGYYTLAIALGLFSILNTIVLEFGWNMTLEAIVASILIQMLIGLLIIPPAIETYFELKEGERIEE